MPFTLYPKNLAPALDLALFARPTGEYRGAPFWSWNSHLDLAQLDRQIDTIKQMGFGGFNSHSRTGLATPYLGDEYLAAVKHCTDRAAREGMLSWLYDEDRWPSGFAGGLVTRDPQHRARHLLWTPWPYGSPDARRTTSDYTAATRNENGTLVGRYAITLRADGRLANYRRITEDHDAAGDGARVWYAYLETAVPNGWFNGQTYADTLSPAAMRRFLETTHEAFKRVVGEHFGGAVPAIFTDEPQFTKKGMLATGDELRDLFLPWTSDLPDTYRAAYGGHELIDHLPELFWNLADDAPSLARYRYHDHVAERFASAFGDTLADWCEANGIGLTGHMLGEATLHGQTRGGGEVMRTMRKFHLPGIDILQDKHEYTTAKQAQSLAHQNGRPGVLSELYGVTGWHFDFVGHKAQGDWQAALGITVRVPHLAWVSMAGESKRDYPAAIGYQSPWFAEYPLVEDHFARVNTVMTRGTPTTRVAVVHPIESGWITWGAADQNAAATKRLEMAFEQLPQWLLFDLIDFDYISESNVARASGACQIHSYAGNTCHIEIGAMRYEAIIVPPMLTIRATTLDILERFVDRGGKVIFAGDPPTLVDATPSNRAASLADRAASVQFERDALLAATDDFRDIQITLANGTASDSILHNLRGDGDARHLFLVNTDRKVGRSTSIRVWGEWDVTRLDTHAGTAKPWSATTANGWTTIRHTFEPHDHLLVTLTPATGRVIMEQPEPTWREVARIDGPVPITLSEPNVLLLDCAAWRVVLPSNSAALKPDWEAVDDILRVDNLARGRLNLPLRIARPVQPWADDAPAPVVGTLELRFEIDSDIDIASPELAIEDLHTIRVALDGHNVPTDDRGWWVDEAIRRVALPPMSRGRHELTIAIPMTRKTNVEACYVLGDFGVGVEGTRTTITPPVRTLAWGDWTSQGLPFYAGNVTYHTTLPPLETRGRLRLPAFKSPLLSVSFSDGTTQKVAFAPFAAEVAEGPSRTVAITVFGNRGNCFGPMHHADQNLRWIAPAAWRTTGDAWLDEYVFKPMGLMHGPTVEIVDCD